MAFGINSLFNFVNRIKKHIKFVKNIKPYLDSNKVKIQPNSIFENLNIDIRNSAPNFTNFYIGQNCIINGSFIFERSFSKIVIGNNTFIGGGLFIAVEEIEIGNDVLISWGCTVIDTNAHSLSCQERKDDVLLWKKSLEKGIHGTYKNWENVISKKITISNNVWIGFNSIILKGVTIGEGSVVAAGSVVVKDVEPFTLVGGNPAKFIKNLD